MNFLSESLDSGTKKIDVVIPFFEHFFRIVNALLLIKMIDNDDFVLFVLIVINLWDEFVPFDVRPRKVKCLSNVVLFVLLWISHIK